MTCVKDAPIKTHTDRRLARAEVSRIADLPCPTVTLALAYFLAPSMGMWYKKRPEDIGRTGGRHHCEEMQYEN